MSRHTLLRIVASAMLAGATFAVPAQEAPDDPIATGDSEGSSEALDVVVVTSQLREQRLTDVPISVSAASGEELQRRFIGDVQSFAEISPSISYVQSQNDLQAELRIRGLGSRSFSQTVESSVSFIVDNVVMSRLGQAWTNLIDVERIEVLRGPQGTLFGKNASAGVIRVTTRRPTDTFEFESAALVTDDGEINVQATVSGPLSERVRARLTGYQEDREGYIENVFDGRKFNGKESFGGRVQFDFTPSDDLELILRADYREQDSTCCPGTFREIATEAYAARVFPVVGGPENRRVNHDGDNINDSEHWGASLEGNYKLGDYTLTSITAYRQWDFLNNADIDQTSLNRPLNYFTFNVNSNTQTNKQFTQELRLSSPADDRVQFVTGLYFMDIDIDVLYRRVFELTTVDGQFPLSNIINYEDVGSEHYSAFADAIWNVSDRFSVFTGARAIYEDLYFWTDRDHTTNGVNTRYVYETEDSDTNWSARAGFQYDLTDDVMSYVSYARGYKGIAFDTFGTFTQEQQEATETLRPETVNAFEVGIKGMILDGRLQFSAALFHSEFEDLQQQARVGDTTVFRQQNVGSVRSQGFELELAARPTDNLTLNAAIALADAEITSFPGAPCYAGQPAGTGPGQCNNGSQDLAGYPLPNNPKWKTYLGTRYDFTIPGTQLNAFVQGSMTWQDDVQFDLAQNPESIQPDYALFDASAGLEFDHVLLTFFVKNLTDKYFTTGLSPTLGFLDPGGRSQFIPREASRFMGMSARIRF